MEILAFQLKSKIWLILDFRLTGQSVCKFYNQCLGILIIKKKKGENLLLYLFNKYACKGSYNFSDNYELMGRNSENSLLD